MTTTSSSSSLNGDITSVQFALHPNITLRLTLHRSIPANPHEIVNKLLELPDNRASEKFAILDAKRIISLDQIAIAANSALLRQDQFRLKNNGVCNRGLALETILCCAGSTNTGSVLRDYAFNKDSNAAKQLHIAVESSGSMNATDYYDVLCLGFCSSDEEFEKVFSTLHVGDAEYYSQMQNFFSRKRTDKETQELMKVYKITKEEVGMVGSSLENAIHNRVAAKFYV